MTDWAPGDRARCVDARRSKGLLCEGETYLVTEAYCHSDANDPGVVPRTPDGQDAPGALCLKLLGASNGWCLSEGLWLHSDQDRGWIADRFVKEEPLVDEESEMLEAVIGGVGPARMETVE